MQVADDYASVPSGSGFRLYDDDDYGLDAAPLPRGNLVNDQMKNYFRPSFIEVTDASAFNPVHPVNKRLVPFHVNEDVSENNPSTVVDDKHNLTDKNECWVCPITAAYQGPQSEDQDPRGDSEGFLMGETAPHGAYGDANYYDHSTVFVETCREVFDNEQGLRSSNETIVNNAKGRINNWITAVISHEMGHHPGNQTDDHPEGGLMGEPMDASTITPQNAIFNPKTIKRFRICDRWSK